LGQALTKFIGDMSGTQWDAVAKTFDANGDGDVQYEATTLTHPIRMLASSHSTLSPCSQELFDAINKYKLAKRKGDSTLNADGSKKGASDLVKSFTFKNPQSCRRNHFDRSARGQGWLQRTNGGETVHRPDKEGPLVKFSYQLEPSATKKKFEYADWTGTEGGNLWQGVPRYGKCPPAVNFGHTSWPKRARTAQPPMPKNLYPDSATYGEASSLHPLPPLHRLPRLPWHSSSFLPCPPSPSPPPEP